MGLGEHEAKSPDRMRLEHAIETFLATRSSGTRSDVAFWGAQFDAGLAWVAHPIGLGGLGVSPELQAVADERLLAAGVDRSNIRRNQIGYGIVAPALVVHAASVLQAQRLRPLFTSEERWCQLFSEPGAGSDLAAVATSAVRDGDCWVVNGQKVWTSMAHAARWGLLLARTDPSVPKHRGITAFMVDMHAAGVEVRPLRQMTGEAEFNEVFLTSVRVPDGHRIGAVGDGWAVAKTTLANERTYLGSLLSARTTAADGLLAGWRECEARSDVLRDRVVQAYTELQLLRWLAGRDAARRTSGSVGPESAVLKLMMAESNKRVTEVGLDLLGSDGMIYGSYVIDAPDEADLTIAEPRKAFLRARANSLEGGTSEILRNVIGERVLGLPSEPRPQ
jgi:alkylation response protein AidB-like acyl-CoA dehydrogenase